VRNPAPLRSTHHEIYKLSYVTRRSGVEVMAHLPPLFLPTTSSATATTATSTTTTYSASPSFTRPPAYQGQDIESLERHIFGQLYRTTHDHPQPPPVSFCPFNSLRRRAWMQEHAEILRGHLRTDPNNKIGRREQYQDVESQPVRRPGWVFQSTSPRQPWQRLRGSRHPRRFTSPNRDARTELTKPPEEEEEGWRQEV
jgi:hypothetical protein